MPLSEHEQKLLDELEKQLASEDPRFAKNISPEPARGLSARRMALGLLVMIAGAGVAVLAISLTSQSGPLAIGLGVVGFVIMVAGGLLAFSSGSRDAMPRAESSGGSGPAKRRGGADGQNFMQRMEQRWERRRDQGR